MERVVLDAILVLYEGFETFEKGIRSIFEDPERYYLFVADNEAHIIVKSGFRQGDPEAFADFIEEKTGLELTVFDN